MKLGILGGTFDPIHMGHLRIAEEVREQLQLDGVIFIPAGNPAFKQDQPVSPAPLRYAQVCRAVVMNPLFDVSPIEIKRPGVTFTIDTLRELCQSYPDNVEFYFIMGADTAQSIGKWRSVAELAELTHLAVAVGRPGSASKEQLRQQIQAAAPFDVHLVECTPLDISSSDIRQRMREGKSLRYFVPNSLLDSTGALRQDLCFHKRCQAKHQHAHMDTACPKKATAAAFETSKKTEPVDVFSGEFYKARKAELATRVGRKRFEHSLRVAKTAKKLARCYGFDEKKARIAGLLHDWDKGLDDEGMRQRIVDLGLEGIFDAWVVERMPKILHGQTAAAALAREFPDMPDEITQAISRHTTAAVDMSDFDMLLYCADALEPGRDYEHIDELRAMIEVSPLHELYFKIYEYWTFILLENERFLHPDTTAVWNANLMRFRG